MSSVSTWPKITERDLRMLVPVRQRRKFVPRAQFIAFSRVAPTVDPDAFRADQDAAAEQSGSAYDR